MTRNSLSGGIIQISTPHFMKSMPMHHLSNVLNKFIGIPYKSGGETFFSCDCYGLIKIFYKDIFSIEINLIRSLINPIKENENEISRLFYEPKKNKFVFGDIVTFLKPTMKGDNFHAGIMINQKFMLHTDIEHGSCVHRFSIYLFKDSLKNVFRLKKEIMKEIEKKR